MKLIALDVGTKRIGVAKADSSVRIAVPYAAVEVDGGEFKKIASLARAWDIHCFVLGLPRNSQGEETAQSRYVRKFARDLKQALPEAKICFQDESLTSVEAEKRLKGRKKGYKKGDIDSEAAAIILQDFLEQRTGAKAKTKATAARHHSVKAAKPHRLIITLAIILVLLGVAGAGGYLYYVQNTRAVFTDLDCSDPEDAESDACEDISFSVEEGATVGNVAVNLEQAGLIRNSLMFQIYYRLNQADTVIQTGEYQLNKTMTPGQILTRLAHGQSQVFSLMLRPGETLRELRQTLRDSGYTDAEIDAGYSADYSGKDYSWMFEGRPEGASLEGYLFGDTYEFYADDSVETILDRMLAEMAQNLKEHDLQAKFAEHGLNLYQGLTLASVVQKEANKADDQAMVAQVFYNRLRENMNLGSDVTVSYAWDLQNPDRDASEVSNAEKLELDSPYNTRKHPGLPYGPICNPGLQALNATANPSDAAAKYLFFLTGDDGVMYYSETEEGHRANMVHCPELCNVDL